MTGLQHSALSYPAADGFVGTAATLVTQALARDARPVVLHDAAVVADVRDTLGYDVAGVSMDVVGRNPARVIPELQRLLAERPDQQLCCVAEPIRTGAPRARSAELSLTDLMLRLPAFSSWNCSYTCTYDDSLDQDVMSSIRTLHDDCDDPEDLVVRSRAEPLSPRPSDSAELGVDRTTLGALRGFVQQRAGRGGLEPDRVDDLVYAVNEVVTNSLCHGEGRARVTLWQQDGAVVCEVRDRGWIRDPLAGLVAPDLSRPSGRGLWLVNQLCDLVQLRTSPSGTTVRLCVDA